jgi:Cu(I)/Ag(I) efflux system membrane protein CusA/SilA
MVGGLVTSFAMELLVYPAIYFLWRRKEVVEGPTTPVSHEESAPMPAGAVP